MYEQTVLRHIPDKYRTPQVSAYIQNHKLHVADSLGAAPQSVRVLNVDSGDPYSVTLDTARDPLREEKLAQKRWPHLGALKLFAGDRYRPPHPPSPSTFPTSPICPLPSHPHPSAPPAPSPSAFRGRAESGHTLFQASA